MKLEAVRKLEVHKEDDLLELGINDEVEIECGNGIVGVFSIKYIGDDFLAVKYIESDGNRHIYIYFDDIKNINWA